MDKEYLENLIKRLEARKQNVYCGGSQSMEWTYDELCQEAARVIKELSSA